MGAIGDEISQVLPPTAPTVKATSTVANTAVVTLTPGNWTFMPETSDVYVLFSTSTTVTTPVVTATATGACYRLPRDQEWDRRCNVTHYFKYVLASGAAAGYLRYYKSTK